MSLKAKLVSSVAAFMLVLALLVVGILAVPSATVNMGGSISFTATDIVGSISMKATANVAATNLEAYTKTAKFTSATTENTVSGWTISDAIGVPKPDSGNAVVTITFTIDNDATDRAMEVTFTKLPALSGSGKGVAISGLKYGSSEDTVLTSGTDVKVNEAFSVSADSIVYVAFTLTVSDFNNGASDSWTAAVTLANPSAD